MALADKVLETLETKESHYHPIYDDSLSLKEKIETISKEIYGARGVEIGKHRVYFALVIPVGIGLVRD